MFKKFEKINFWPLNILLRVNFIEKIGNIIKNKQYFEKILYLHVFGYFYILLGCFWNFFRELQGKNTNLFDFGDSFFYLYNFGQFLYTTEVKIEKKPLKNHSKPRKNHWKCPACMPWQHIPTEKCTEKSLLKSYSPPKIT